MGLGSLLGLGGKKRTRERASPIPTHPPPYTDKEKAGFGHRPRGNNPIIGRATPRGQYDAEQAKKAVDDTNPPDAVKDESSNIGDAYGAAERTRRRARAGSAGRVVLPGGPGGRNTGTPRTLIGF